MAAAAVLFVECEPLLFPICKSTKRREGFTRRIAVSIFLFCSPFRQNRPSSDFPHVLAKGDISTNGCHCPAAKKEKKRLLGMGASNYPPSSSAPYAAAAAAAAAPQVRTATTYLNGRTFGVLDCTVQQRSTVVHVRNGDLIQQVSCRICTKRCPILRHLRRRGDCC